MDLQYYSNIHPGLAFSHIYPSIGLSTNGGNLTTNTMHPLSFPTISNSLPTASVRRWPDFSVPVLTTSVPQPDSQNPQYASHSYQTTLSRAEPAVCTASAFTPSGSIQHSPTSLSRTQLELSISTAGPAFTQAGTIQQSANETLAAEFLHPFYCRRRNNIAAMEGMTRTRDKYRVVYNEKQRAGLEKEFHEQKFITSKRKSELAERLSLSERQVKIWFQNRRAKERRQTKKRDDSLCGDGDDNKNTTQCVGLQQPPSCLYASQDQPTARSSILTNTDCRYQQQNPELFGKAYHQHDEQTVPQFPLSPSNWVSSSNNSVLASFDISPFGTSSAIDICHRT